MKPQVTKESLAQWIAELESQPHLSLKEERYLAVMKYAEALLILTHNMVPHRKPIFLDAPISLEWAARTTGYRNGFNDCVDEILRNIEEAK